MVAVGTLASGWISERFQKHKLTIIVAAIISIPAILLMGQAGNLAQLTVFTMLAWLAGGTTIAMINILTGLYADPAQRGRIFGTIGLALGTGQVLGGLSAGPVVERWGFSALFVFAALPWLLPLLAAPFLSDKRIEQTQARVSRPASLGGGFWLLILAALFCSILAMGGSLARPLAMNDLGFDASAIASTAAVSGMIVLPLPFVIGWASDRFGRKRVLAVCYGAVGLGALMLITASSLWHFWLSTILFTVNVTSLSAGSALVTDLVRPQSLSVALSRYAASVWIAGVIGFGATGFIMQQFGLQSTFLTMLTLPIISMLLLFAISRRPHLAQA